MDIAALKEKLGDETFAELSEHITALTAQRDAAKKESIDGRKALKAKVAELETSQSQLLEKLGLDSLDDIANLPDAKGQAEAAAQMGAQIKRLEKQIVELSNSNAEISGKHRSAVQESILGEAMSAHKFVDRDVVKAFVSARLVWEGDELFYKSDDGSLASVSDGITGLAKSKPALLESVGARGAGVPGGVAGGGGGTPSAKIGGTREERLAAIKEKFPELATA